MQLSKSYQTCSILIRQFQINIEENIKWSHSES
jgi:hypothetical protein